jgi:hypothetical protein
MPRPSACDPNSYSLAGASSCTACPAGSTSASASSTCTCSDGYASAGTGASLVCTGPCFCWCHFMAHCHSHAMRRFVPSSRMRCGLFQQRRCGLRWYVRAAHPVLGRAASSHHAPHSLACLAGTYSAAIASSCSVCPSNSTSNAEATTCTCAAGFSSSGSGASLACTSTHRALLLWSRCAPSDPIHPTAGSLRRQHVQRRPGLGHLRGVPHWQHQQCRRHRVRVLAWLLDRRCGQHARLHGCAALVPR